MPPSSVGVPTPCREGRPGLPRTDGSARQGTPGSITGVASTRKPGMFQDRVTYVVIPRYPLTDFIFDGLGAREDIVLIEHPMPPRGRFGSLIRFLEVLLPWWKGSSYFNGSYLHELSAIREHDNVLFFAIENLKDLKIIRKFIRARCQSVWLWNPVGAFRRHKVSRYFYHFWLRRTGLKAFTFNPADVRSDTIGLANQVYRSVDEIINSASNDSAHDVYFLGIDKGRLNLLQALKSELEQMGLTTLFRIVPDKRRRYTDNERAQLTPGWLPYRDNLRIVQQSRVLLEILQSTQNGPTIRSMEAAFFGKKLITNNRGMRQSPLYHRSRIFILGEDDMENLKSFVDEDPEPVNPSILRGHDIEHWIEQFIN